MSLPTPIAPRRGRSPGSRPAGADVANAAIRRDTARKVELFLGVKFRPLRLPRKRQHAEIGRPALVAFGAGRSQDPRLRASREHMRNWNQPGRVIKRTGAKVDDFRSPRAVAVEAAAAISAEPGYHRDARWRRVAPCLRRALQDMKMFGPDRHVQRERAAGRSLTIGAIAGVEQQRKRRDLVADRSARTAAGHRKRRPGGAHDQPRSNIPSKHYPENHRAATSIFRKRACQRRHRQFICHPDWRAESSAALRLFWSSSICAWPSFARPS